MGRKGTTVPFADQKVKMHVSMSYKFSLKQLLDTGASCNILPLYKAKALFGEDLKLGKPTVNLKGYNDSPVGNLGSCIVYLYRGNKMYRVLSEVADSKGHMILGRKQVVPVIQKRTQERITINGKTHSLPTTKDYLLQEYADVFQGIGTLSYPVKRKL